MENTEINLEKQFGTAIRVPVRRLRVGQPNRTQLNKRGRTNHGEYQFFYSG
jgi:hypothetical protein